MHFCPIMPVKAFEQFKNSSTHWMALVQYLQIREYRHFFQDKLAAGETVILDNGAYEGVPTNGKDLNFWVKEIKPTVVILPDKPGDFRRTIQKVNNYLDEFGLPKGVEGMTVLHAADGCLQHFTTAYELCPTKWVGFSKLTGTYGQSMKRPCARWMFAKWLQDRAAWRSQLVHHALGMCNGDVAELEYLTGAGFHSCDSSAPVWRGLLGYGMSSDSWPNYEFQPIAGEEANNFKKAAFNLEEVLAACGEDRGR